MSEHAVTRILLEDFTAFAKLDLEFSPGVNLFIGGNSTGKTHLLKLLYAAVWSSGDEKYFGDKLVQVFLPSQREHSRLRRKGALASLVQITSGNRRIDVTLEQSPILEGPVILESRKPFYREGLVESVFIPAGEVLSNAPGFLSLWKRRELHFDETYADILEKAYLPALREGEVGEDLMAILESLKESIEGEVIIKGQEFFRRKGDWELEFSLLAEGYRKIGLLWLLIRNGTVGRNSILFWDELETNLNPTMIGKLVDTLLGLHRLGVQIFIATHNYVVLKEFDLRSEPRDRIRFFSFYHDEQSGEIAVEATEEYDTIDPNLILDTFVDLYDRDVDRALKTGEAS